MNKPNNTNQIQWGTIGGMMYTKRSPMQTTSAKPQNAKPIIPCYIPEGEIESRRSSWYNIGVGVGEIIHVRTKEGQTYIHHPTITGVHVEDMNGNRRHCSWAEYKGAVDKANS